MSRRALVVWTLAIGLCHAAPAGAAGVRLGGDETFAHLGLLLQARADLDQADAPTGRDLGTELYLRRARILFFGQLRPGITFFVDTDSPNLGKRGDTTSSIYLQDAFVELDLHPALQIDAGLLLLPFSHHGMTGATGLLLLDYHAAALRYPSGSHRVWRDTGVMLRGQLAAGLIDYRLSLTNGVRGDATLEPRQSSDGAQAWTERADPRNRRDRPRVTGRLAVNLLAPTTGRGAVAAFGRGVHLSRGDGRLRSGPAVLSAGVSADWQDDLNVTWAPAVADQRRKVARRGDYLALAVDLLADLPLTDDGGTALTAQAALYSYRHDAGRLRAGEERFLPGGSPSPSGTALFVELGLRRDTLALQLGADWFAARHTPGDDGDLLAIYGGPAWWWLGHDANLKLQVGASRQGLAAAEQERWRASAALQLQLLF